MMMMTHRVTIAVIMIVSLFSIAYAENVCYYSVKSENGVHYLVSPSGDKMIGLFVDVINWYSDYCPDLDTNPYHDSVVTKYGSTEAAWATATVNKLRSWNFNIAGVWSTKEVLKLMPRMVILDAASSTSTYVDTANSFDFYSPYFAINFEKFFVDDHLDGVNDPDIVGYIFDDEMRWQADWRDDRSLLATFIQECDYMPSTCTATIDYLSTKYSTIAALNAAWGVSYPSFNSMKNTIINDADPAVIATAQTFSLVVAEHYYKIIHDIIRKYDDNHLLFGVSEVLYTDETMKALLEIASHYVDAQAFNFYSLTLEPGQLDVFPANKPLINTAFSVRSYESSCPNTHGAGPVVNTQAERAQKAVEYYQYLLNDSRVIGLCWFQYADQPAQGRGDGENSNYGLVDIKDVTYTALTNALTTANANAISNHHGSSGKTSPKCAPRSCILDCSGTFHGCCVDGQCVCHGGYSGAYCQNGVGQIVDNFTSVNISRWNVLEDSTSTFAWSPSRVTVSNGLHYYFNNSGCPNNCGGLNYASASVTSVSPMTFGSYRFRVSPPCRDWFTLSVASYGDVDNEVRLAVFSEGVHIVVKHDSVTVVSQWKNVLENVCGDLDYSYGFDWFENILSFYANDVILYNVTDVPTRRM